MSGWDADNNSFSFPQLTANASTLATGEGEQFEGHCMSCHEDGIADSLPASGADQTKTSPFIGSAAPPVLSASGWTNAGHNRPVATFPGSPVSCIGDGTNGCADSCSFSLVGGFAFAGVGVGGAGGEQYRNYKNKHGTISHY